MKESEELKKKQELEETGKINGQRPVDIIREMNPGSFIPTGAQLAGMLKKESGEDLEKSVGLDRQQVYEYAQGLGFTGPDNFHEISEFMVNAQGLQPIFDADSKKYYIEAISF